MPWRVRRADVEFFRDDLWKDLRPFPRAPSENQFAKDCFEHRFALFEASILLYLRERLGSDAVPEPLGVSDRVLVMERVRGVRLFDLIRHLKSIENVRRDGIAQKALNTLLNRARTRLGEIQRELYSVREIFANESYPLGRKLNHLLGLFVRVLDIRQQPHGWEDCLVDFVDFWESECVFVPFRDATTKNMIVSDLRLAATPGVDDAEAAQRVATAILLDSESADYWNSVRLVDIDFSSINHLTSPEDDPISLMCHEWTFGCVELTSKSFLLEPMLGVPNDERTAASFLVRYLRFGGRKLAYKLINAQGFKVRFAYDDPLFYFERLPRICSDVCEDFANAHRPLLELIQLIADTASAPSPRDAALMSVDHLRRFYPSVQYWQQNPVAP